MKTLEQIKRDAAKFSKRWSGKSLDKYKDFKPFWLNFFERVIGVDNAAAKIEFDKSVETPEGKKKHVGAYVPEIGLLIIQTKHLPEKDPLPTKAGEPWPDAMMDFYKQVLHDINLLEQQGCPVKFVIASDYKLWICYDRNYCAEYPSHGRCKLRNLGKDIAYLEYVFNLVRNKDELELRRAAIDDILLGYGYGEIDPDSDQETRMYAYEDSDLNFFDHIDDIEQISSGQNETTVSASLATDDGDIYRLEFVVRGNDIWDLHIFKHARVYYWDDIEHDVPRAGAPVYDYRPGDGYELFDRVLGCIPV